MRDMGFICNNIVWMLDPVNRFPHVEPEALLESLGVIPQFITEDTEDVIQTAIDRYGMLLGGPMKGGEVLEHGEYVYPEDPTLYPYASAVLPNRGMVVHIYDFGMISFVNSKTKESATYRFD